MSRRVRLVRRTTRKPVSEEDIVKGRKEHDTVTKGLVSHVNNFVFNVKATRTTERC